jgi:hypothetical protein
MSHVIRESPPFPPTSNTKSKVAVGREGSGLRQRFGARADPHRTFCEILCQWVSAAEMECNREGGIVMSQEECAQSEVLISQTAADGQWGNILEG